MINVTLSLLEGGIRHQYSWQIINVNWQNHESLLSFLFLSLHSRISEHHSVHLFFSNGWVIVDAFLSVFQTETYEATPKVWREALINVLLTRKMRRERERSTYHYQQGCSNVILCSSILVSCRPFSSSNLVVYYSYTTFLVLSLFLVECNFPRQVVGVHVFCLLADFVSRVTVRWTRQENKNIVDIIN